MDPFQEIKDFLLEKPSQSANERLAICKKCEYYTRVGICGKCGCVLAIKARLPMFHCPLKKW
jgi:hypothetical protein